LRDIQEAAEKSNLFAKGLAVTPFPRKNGDVDIQSLEKAFRNGGANRCFAGKAYVSRS
jgi:hypothetical protein